MQTPERIVRTLLEQSGGVRGVLSEDDDIRDELETAHAELMRGVARWPFTRTELQNPERCSEKDFFLAKYECPDIDPDHDVPVKVRRDCSVVGYVWDEGCVDFDSLMHIETGEYADEWRDVYVKHDGFFGGWVVK